MEKEEFDSRSRWIIRVMEWDDSKARYPNLWHEGVPRHVLATERVAGRLRLGDLVAAYSPTSVRHPERSEKFVGLARVVGLRRADLPGHGWIDLETAHRFDPPLDAGQAPRRVFMCCDPNWPEADVALFRTVLDAAVASGWEPGSAEREPGEPADVDRESPAPRRAGQGGATPATSSDAVEASDDDPSDASDGPETASPPPPSSERGSPGPDARSFAGSSFSADMRDPRDRTWLAAVALNRNRLEVTRLEPTGRAGLQARLRNPDARLMKVEAIGLAFPFGLPRAFAESLAGDPLAQEGWWALARRLERLKRPEFLVALQEFRKANGEVRRLTDESAGAPSPLRRSDADLGARCFHGIRMIAEDRSRYAIRPFETARGKLLLEVCPETALHRLVGADPLKASELLSRLGALELWPIEVPERFRKSCLHAHAAVEAVVAARCAAVAVLTEEADRPPERLAGDRGGQVRLEGWIYGLGGAG